MKYAVIGNPVEHSLSPQIFEIFGKKLGLKIDFQKISLTADELRHHCDKLINTLDAFCVTMPLKSEILNFCHTHSEEVKKIAAANSIRVNGKKLEAHNTDYLAIKEIFKNYNNKTVLLYGAGGAARAVIKALLDSNVKTVSLCNRSESKAIELLRSLKDDRVRFISWKDKEKYNFADIYINATSVGMNNEEFNFLPKQLVDTSVAMDLVYSLNSSTSFIKKVKSINSNIKTLSGLDMLIWQAIFSLKKWSNVEFDQDMLFDFTKRELIHGS